MRHSMRVVALAALLSLTVVASGCARPATPDAAYAEAMAKAKPAQKSNRHDIVLDAVQPVIDGPFYAHMSDAQRHDLDQAAGLALYVYGDHRAAHAAYVRATQSPRETEQDWSYRVETAARTNDFADAFSSLQILVNKHPNFIKYLPDAVISQMEQGFGTLPDGPAAQRRFEEYLEAVDWKPHDPLFSPDVIALHHALHQLEDGITGIGAWRLGQLEEPMVVATVGADKRFDAAVAGNPERTDVASANARRLARFQALAAANPDVLAFQSAVVGHLSTMGRETEALSLLDKAMAKARQSPRATQPAGRNLAVDYQHAVVQRSYILFKLGLTEQALEQARDQDSPLLPGRWLVALGRGREAIATLRPMVVEDQTFLAQAHLAALRVCAARQAGDAALERENLAFLQDHPLYNPGQRLEALLCAGDLEAAAADTKAGLADPRRRFLILGALQQFMLPPVQTPFQTEMERRRTALRERPDVKAAIEKVGRINRQPIQAADIY